MDPGEFLAAYVRQYVTTLVSPELIGPVTEATGHTMAMILNDPNFVSQLRAVIQLREENQWLRAQVAHLQAVILSASGSPTGSTPRKASSTSKKVSPRKVSTSTSTSSRSAKPRAPRVGGTSSRASKAAFMKGVRQAKR